MADLLLTAQGDSALAATTTHIAVQDSGVWKKTTIPAVVRKSPFITVAASDSYNKEYATYTCDGTADDVQIQQAIDDLGDNKGTVRMLAGNYNIATQIEINDDAVVLEGEGPGGLAAYGTTLWPVQTFADTGFVINVQLPADTRPLTSVQLKNFAIRANTLNNNVSGINFCCYRGLLENVWVQSMTRDGLMLRQISGNTNRETMLSKCHFARNTRYGIYSTGCTDQEWFQNEVHNNGTSNFYGNLSSVQVFGGQFYAGDENPAGQSTLRNVHIALGGNKVRFVGVRFEHGREHLVHLDGTTNGGEVMFDACTFRNGGGETANTWSQLKITGNQQWVLQLTNSRFYSDVSSPKYNLEFPTASSIMRFARISGNRFADAATATMPALTVTSFFKGTVNNLGVNVGDPNSTGDWTGATGQLGTMVRNTSTGDIWLCTAATISPASSTWKQIA